MGNAPPEAVTQGYSTALKGLGRACWPAPGSHSGSKSKWGLRAANLHLPPQRGLPPPCRLCRCGLGPGSAGLDQGYIIQGLLKGRVLCMGMQCSCGKAGTCRGREMPGHRSSPLGDKAYAYSQDLIYTWGLFPLKEKEKIALLPLQWRAGGRAVIFH